MWRKKCPKHSNLYNVQCVSVYSLQLWSIVFHPIPINFCGQLFEYYIKNFGNCKRHNFGFPLLIWWKEKNENKLPTNIPKCSDAVQIQALLSDKTVRWLFGALLTANYKRKTPNDCHTKWWKSLSGLNYCSIWSLNESDTRTTLNQSQLKLKLNCNDCYI